MISRLLINLLGPDPDGRRTGEAQARAALEELCRNHWYPLFALGRCEGHDVETAQNLVQGVFTRLSEREDLRRLELERGRSHSFSSWRCLLTSPGKSVFIG